MNTLRLELYLKPINLVPKTIPTTANYKPTKHIYSSKTRRNKTHINIKKSSLLEEEIKSVKYKNSRKVIIGAMSLGVAMLLMGFDDDHHNKAMAFWPEGPLVEEFWDNMRRYALYALTVSTGALAILLEPIFELMKNPISAVLVVVILGGGFFIVTQVVSAMIGLSDFSYDYNY